MQQHHLKFIYLNYDRIKTYVYIFIQIKLSYSEIMKYKYFTSHHVFLWTLKGRYLEEILTHWKLLDSLRSLGIIYLINL